MAGFFAGGVEIGKAPSTRQGDGEFAAATPPAFPESILHTNSPGPMGHVNPACCLNTDCPVWPRQLSNMKDQMAYPQPEYMAEWNAGTADPNGAKSKRKTIFIKLHPKPYAPRNNGPKPRRSRLHPQ
jgi:hypothetical protein